MTPPLGFRARAGVLTLMVASSSLDRRSLLCWLAELASGSEEIELEAPSEQQVIWEMVEDDFLLEVADESMLEPDGSVGPDTPMRPSAAGKELMVVGMVLGQWQDAQPPEPLGLGGAEEARDFIMAVLVGGLATTALHRIARGPASSEEVCEALDGLEAELSEDGLEAAEHVGLIEPVPGEEDEEGEVRYGLTEWGRRAIVPLVAAARFEHRHPRGDTLAPDRLDVEMAFGLTLSLLTLDPRVEGRCRLAVRLAEDGGGPAGVVVEVRGGRIEVVESELGLSEPDLDGGPPPPDMLIADAGAWMEELVGGDPLRSELEGESELGRTIVEAMRSQVFAVVPGKLPKRRPRRS